MNLLYQNVKDNTVRLSNKELQTHSQLNFTQVTVQNDIKSDHSFTFIKVLPNFPRVLIRHSFHGSADFLLSIDSPRLS